MNFEDVYIRCGHCSKFVAPGEIDELSKDICPILQDSEVYHICEYCFGSIEARLDNISAYWTNWVIHQRNNNDFLKQT
ncbi:MAG TPA: hypothetical protein VEZ13_17315 [Brevibacillus sp.]|nr:hypothetical protein [Brevibacillus sp.]